MLLYVAIGVVIGGIAVAAVISVPKVRRMIFSAEKPRTFSVIVSRKSVLRLFKKIFLDFEPNAGGRILLMSNTGGLPEYNPFPKILDLGNRENIDIYVAMSASAFYAWAWANPVSVIALRNSKNIHVVLFDNLVPYSFRMGINTEISVGFLCAYHGKEDERVFLEGVSSTNALFLRGMEALYFGLLSQGTEWKRDYQPQNGVQPGQVVFSNELTDQGTG